MRRFGVAIATLLVVLGARPASPQRLRGRLVDVASNEPLVAGLVTLLRVDGTSVVTSVTNNAGDWALDVPGAGTYYVAARRMGYQPWTGPVQVNAGDDLTSVLRLQRIPLVLDPIEVSAEATRRYLASAGFYDRQRADFGHYITPEHIVQRQAVRITDLLAALPGVTLARPAVGNVGPLAVQLRGSNLSQGGLCRPRVFVDGLLYARGDARPRRGDAGQATERSPENEIQQRDQGLSIDDIGHPSTIAAIEVYRSASEVPVQFGGASAETLCGVIVIWTRAGSARTRQPVDSAKP